MKILVLSFYYYPDLCAGSFRCTNLVKQLKKQVDSECQIEIITTAPNRYSSYQVNARDFEQEDNVVIRRIQLPKHQSGFIDQAKAFMHYANQVRKLIKNQEYDLVFATSSRLMTAVLGTWVAKRTKSKLYLDIRDIFVDTIGDVFPKKISLCAKPMFSMLEKWSFRHADHINLVSEGFHRYFASRYPAAKLTFFTNGIDSEFLVANNEDNHRNTKTSDLLTVVYAGNIGEGQGLHLVIPALAEAFKDKIKFRIIGDGGRIEQLKQASSESKNITFVAPLNRQELIDEYQQADILFLHLNDYPAFQKVLPSKVFEYAAMGKPIWAGVAGYPANFIKNEIPNAAVFYPCNIEEAVNVFSTLKMEQTSRVAFIEKYTRENIMRSMVKTIIACQSE